MSRPADRPAAEPAVWRQPDGAPMSCESSIKVLRENLVEIRDICQEALEDAVLMKVDEAQFRAVLRALVDSLDAPFPAKDEDAA
ncbi:MAG: hypothetical protein AB7N54_14150 [Alphaproteobacteria bacterium]